eukprot:TRINITY_DN54478_c0_g1_i1.p1 TRINITY_DN54478_c0_g1~~TRINITY_DN54478_c0_g1_i1.p1  ORF type:complete len:1099 (+),score=261.18 TRINITY_DN54478_c0_g1_i1:98-3394(+)
MTKDVEQNDVVAEESQQITSTTIITDKLYDLELSKEVIDEVQSAWKLFADGAKTVEAGGEALYEAFYMASPGAGENFKTPRAILGPRFLAGLSAIFGALGDSKRLHGIVDALGFHHLHFELTAQRVTTFRDSMIAFFEGELGPLLSPTAKDGLTHVLSYVGGALVSIRSQRSEHLRLLAESWEVANEKEAEQQALAQGTVLEAAGSSEMSGESGGNKKKEESTAAEAKGQSGGQVMPQTFNDMFKMNAAVMGISNVGWMNLVLDQFDHMVTNVTCCYRLQEECDILLLRLNSKEESDVNLQEFKTCMMAALRSILPKQWSTQHEVAWAWFWDNISGMLRPRLTMPQQLLEAVDDFLEKLAEEDAYDIRSNIYVRFFELAPVGQEYFKQSNTRLHFIASRIFAMISEIYHEPHRLVKEISALGLRHVGFGIPVDLFGPFVTASCEVLAPRLLAQDMPLVLEGYRFSLGLMSRILVRTIVEGSTVVMKAINANSVVQLKKAFSSAPRGMRASWLLLVQVGSQNISPLAWAVDSGKVEVARAILTDLLVIRADRDRYYYSVNDLFRRHNDIVKRICVESPMLLTTLLEGLVWRSHRPKDGFRRANYYVEHMLVNSKGDFSEGLRYITSLGDPGIMADPIVVTVTDGLWHGIVYRQFLRSKMWNIVGLAVFEIAQGVLPRLRLEEEGAVNIMIFVGKVFIYVFGMGRLAYEIFAGIYRWSRQELIRIFEEIDEDGSGEIDWDEFMAGLGMFRDLIKEKIMGFIAIFSDKGARAKVDTDKKKVGSKKGKQIVDLLLFGTLVAMCAFEPMWWCSGSVDWPTNDCEAALPNKKSYSIFVMCSMAVHWLVLMDLAVFSTDLSSFLLVIGHVLQEVRQFLTALCFLLMLFGSAICIYCRHCEDEGGVFSDLPNAVISLLAVTIRLYQGDFRDMGEDTVLLAMVLLSTTFSAVLLLNLLVAQLNLSYEYIYRDMLGFARLNRASLICEAMKLTSRGIWDRFKTSLKLDQKLEFDEGDVGLAGGVQCLELASLHHTAEEQIRRFGGTTSPLAPWPEEKNDDASSRFERLEAMLNNALKTPLARTKLSKGSGGAGASGSGSDEDSLMSQG